MSNRQVAESFRLIADAWCQCESDTEEPAGEDRTEEDLPPSIRICGKRRKTSEVDPPEKNDRNGL
jgi:hypothetical protein